MDDLQTVKLTSGRLLVGAACELRLTGIFDICLVRPISSSGLWSADDGDDDLDKVQNTANIVILLPKWA